MRTEWFLLVFPGIAAVCENLCICHGYRDPVSLGDMRFIWPQPLNPDRGSEKSFYVKMTHLSCSARLIYNPGISISIKIGRYLTKPLWSTNAENDRFSTAQPLDWDSEKSFYVRMAYPILLGASNNLGISIFIKIGRYFTESLWSTKVENGRFWRSRLVGP